MKWNPEYRDGVSFVHIYTHPARLPTCPHTPLPAITCLCNRKNNSKRMRCSTFANSRFLCLSSQHPACHSIPSPKLKWICSHMTTVPSRGVFFKLQWCPQGCVRLHFPKMTREIISHPPCFSYNVTLSQGTSKGGVYVFSSPVGQAWDYEESDAVWLPRLGYLLPGSQGWSPEPLVCNQFNCPETALLWGNQTNPCRENTWRNYLRDSWSSPTLFQPQPLTDYTHLET